MLKVINCPMGEEITIEQRRRSEVAMVSITWMGVSGPSARILPENHLQMIEALVWGLDVQDRHRVIMSIIATMPNFMKQQYAPADLPKKKKR